MKKTIIWITAIAAVATVGYLVYQKKHRYPKVDFSNIDWIKGFADITIDGKKYQISKDLAQSYPGGYSVQFSKSYWPDSNGLDITSLVLMKNGSIINTIAER